MNQPNQIKLLVDRNAEIMITGNNICNNNKILVEDKSHIGQMVTPIEDIETIYFGEENY